MRIGFFGTPDIAAYCLNELAGSFEIAFAVTGADKPSGRHLRLHPSPVKEAALARGIPVYHPALLRDPGFIEDIRQADADLFVVVAYGRIIPAGVFTMPRLKTINLHPSLLPKYRGAAPVEWALINGEHETGISVQLINERLDAGDVLSQVSIPLDPDMSAGELYDIVLPVGAGLLVSAIVSLHDGTAEPRVQEEEEATYCGKINRERACIDWRLPARRIHDLVRGLNPRPGAWTDFRGSVSKIWKTSVFTDEPAMRIDPGRLRIFNRKRLLAGTGEGCLEIVSIQPETKKAMDALSFINGYRIMEADHFTRTGEKG